LASQRAAAKLAQDAEQIYLNFLGKHGLAFVAELAPEAKRIAAEYARVADEYARRLVPIQERHSELRAAVELFIGGIPDRFRPDDLPDSTDFGTPPIPSPESVVRAQEDAA
jgi:hypothetical protein